MSTPRERPGEGPDDRDDEGAGWHEPAHLGQGGSSDADRPGEGGAAWEPPGWSLPPAESRPVGSPSPSGVAAPGGGFFGRRRRPPSELEQVFAYEGDHLGVQAWAIQHGWTLSDGNGPEDAVLQDLLAAGPVRLSKDHRPAGVLRGRAGGLELVAFDVVYASGRYVVPEYAVTAAPVLAALPYLRLSPARLWKHRTAGLLQVPSGDPEFDTRWVLLTPEDGPAVRHLVEDPTVRGLLLGSDDGDEFWAAASHVAAVRPDGHRPQLVEHHARLLTAVVGALAAAL